MIELKKDAKYALVIPTSMGLRLTPENGQPFHCSDTLKMQATSAESNVGSVSSYLGLPVHILTAFVKASPVSRFIKNNLGHRGMTCEGPELEQEDPWGYRHQINMADSGAGSRGPRVANDRAGEVGRELTAAHFDLDRIFGEEGAQLIHLSGLIAALSPKTSQFCVDVARKAKEHGTKIAFDLNHRASFWTGREQELHEAFREIASLADVLIGNEEDFQKVLGYEVEGAGEELNELPIESYKKMVRRVAQDYPNLKVIGTTLREVKSGLLNNWSAILYWAETDTFFQGPTFDNLEIEDRVGGAGNVAANASALGAAVTLIGVVGADEEATALRTGLEKAGVTPRLIAADSVRTTTKLRVLPVGLELGAAKAKL